MRLRDGVVTCRGSIHAGDSLTLIINDMGILLMGLVQRTIVFIGRGYRIMMDTWSKGICQG